MPREKPADALRSAKTFDITYVLCVFPHTHAGLSQRLSAKFAHSGRVQGTPVSADNPGAGGVELAASQFSEGGALRVDALALTAEPPITARRSRLGRSPPVR